MRPMRLRWLPLGTLQDQVHAEQGYISNVYALPIIVHCDSNRFSAFSRKLWSHTSCKNSKYKDDFGRT